MAWATYGRAINIALPPTGPLNTEAGIDAQSGV